MASVGGELRSWGVLGVIVLVVGAGLALRPGTSEPASLADASAAPGSDAPAPPGAGPVGGPNPPLSGGISPPTRAPAPSQPVAPPSTPAPVAATPSAPPPAAAPAPTPVAVHDDDPVLLTEERVDGAFGQTLTIGTYRVHAVRKSVPVDDGCIQNHTGDYEIFDITITYSGPIFDVQLAIDSPTAYWCVDGSGGASLMFPSGVTRQVIVGYEDAYVAADAPFVVWVTPVNGPQTLTFAFH